MQRKYITLGNILSAKWLIHEQYAQAWFPTVNGMLNGHVIEPAAEVVHQLAYEAKSHQASNVHFISEYGKEVPVSAAPKNSIAVISMLGPITKYDQYCGNAGTETKAALIQEAINNPNINGIILNIDSGGGEASAVEGISNIIRNSSKPVVAYVNGMAASAAYWIASAAHQIVIGHNASEVGSIGTYTQLADFNKYYEDRGIKVHTIYAPQSTEKNRGYREALAGKYKSLEQDLAVFTNMFINQVKEYRDGKLGTDPDMFKGSMYYAKEAIEQGLVDEQGDFLTAIQAVERLAPAGSFSSQTHATQLSDMKIQVQSTQTALIALLGISMAENAESVEHELTAENISAIETALAAAATFKATTEQQLAEANTNLQAATEQVGTLTTERDNALVQVDELKQQLATNPGATNVIAKADANNNPANKGFDAYAPEGADYIEKAKEMFN